MASSGDAGQGSYTLPAGQSARREKLRQLLSCKGKCVVYPLTGRGFASEINNLLLALLYCLTHGLRFRLDTEYWNAAGSQGWTNYFLAFCDESRSGNPRGNAGSLVTTARGVSRVGRRVQWVASSDVHGHHIWHPMRSPEFLCQHFRIPELEIDGDVFHAKAELLKIIWAFNSEVLEAARAAESAGLEGRGYVGVHIRQGDKVAGPGKEAAAIAMHDYVALACRVGAPWQQAYLASDDTHAVEGFREACPSDWRVHSRCRPQSRGHDQGYFNSLPAETRSDMIVDLIVDIHLLAKADAFLGTYSSNLSRFVHLLRGGVACHSLDVDWHPS